MTIPQLKAFDCFDHDPIEQWKPDSDADVAYSLCLYIGPPDEEGADYFYVDVTTTRSIDPHDLGRFDSQRRIVVSPYSWQNALDEVHAKLAKCAGDDWSQQSELLAKHFNWQFENYRP